jgi:hypothetical protein
MEAPVDELKMVRELLAEGRPPTTREVAEARCRVLAATQPTHATRPAGAARFGRAARLARRVRAGLSTEANRTPSCRRAAVLTATALTATALTAIAAIVGGAFLATSPAAAPATTGGPAVGAGRGPVALSARRLLLTAADTAEHGPAAGARWRLDLRSGAQVLTTGGYLIDHRYREQQWIPRSATEPTWRIIEDLGGVPVGPADVAAWRRDGSPGTWTIPPRKLTVAERKRVAEKEALIHRRWPNYRIPRYVEQVSATGIAPYAAREDSHGAVGVIATKPRSLTDLAALPAEPVQLRTWLRAELSHIAGESVTDAELFREAVHIALYLPVAPAVRSAAFRMLAQLPGVQLAGETRDPLGRTGYAVGLPDGAATQDRLILDTRSGMPLALETVVTDPYPADPHLARPGQLSSYEVVLDAGWTDARPHLPARRLDPEDVPG